jgi:hypothetical protein
MELVFAAVVARAIASTCGHRSAEGTLITSQCSRTRFSRPMLVEVRPRMRRSNSAHAKAMGEMLGEPSGLVVVIRQTGVPT